MTDITCHPFDSNMIADCVALYQKVYAQPPWNESWHSTQAIFEFFHNHLINNFFMGYVAKRGTTIVGVSIGFSKPWIGGMEYYIDESFIDTDHHHQGVGSKLMAHIKAECRLRQHSALILNTQQDFPAQVFYERNGFSVEKGLVILTSSV